MTAKKLYARTPAPPPPVRYSEWWLALWVVNIAALIVIVFFGATALEFGTAFLALFLVPEIVGLLHERDNLPPLTYVTRRYVPEWLTYIFTGVAAAWLITSWWPVSPHPEPVTLVVVAMASWLVEHWMVSYATTGDGL